MMTVLDHGALLFTEGKEVSFPLPDSPSVLVAPLLRHEDGHSADVFFLTIPADASVPREQHPFSETLVPLAGQLTCSVDDEPPMTIRPGQALHIPADQIHFVANQHDEPVVAAMIIGV
jgi:quercetin dioxygenase-like cupin family protein